ncbi:MAG: FAD-dependent 5-carboxymethylaminomethyl-2-thiouridine(34) oxidoreductase MnmC [Caldimonas sp.]
MKTAPVVAGRVELDAVGLPRSPDFGDLYHPRQGAVAQARQVFLGGNDLPSRWRGRERFVVLETGFGLGNNFLATWSAWQNDPERCGQLRFISIEARPLARGDMAAMPREGGLAPLATQLAAAWPALTCNLHRLSFDADRVQLLLAFGEVAAWLPQIVASVDAFYLDGFAPAKNPQMWEPRLFKAMGRIAAPDATAATWSVARAVREGLCAAGFDVRIAPGSGGKREITVAQFAPRFVPRQNARRLASRVEAAVGGVAHEPIAIIGAGLAGCAAAWALAEQGRRSLLFERRSELASEGSGNAAGLFHGVVHRHDGHHARFHRAAAFEAQRAVMIGIDEHGIRGDASGLLRIETRTADVATMQAILDRLGLPAEYVRAVSPAEASTLAATVIASPAWYFAAGGWVDPRGLARSFAARAGARVEVRCNHDIAAIRHVGGKWNLLDASARVVATADTVVLANAGAAMDLLGAPPWPMQRTRGQVSSVAVSRWPGAESLRLPIAGSGYLLPAVDGRMWFGATSQLGDIDPQVRIDDHRANVERLSGLLGTPPSIDVATLAGRAGFRWSSSDRLPLIGAVPLAAVGTSLGLTADASTSPRPDQPRFTPRAPGLFVIVGLGSRGIAVSALGAQVLAASVTGAPIPLEADLLDAIDPARFASRVHRRLGKLPDAENPGIN